MQIVNPLKMLKIEWTINTLLSVIKWGAHCTLVVKIFDQRGKTVKTDAPTFCLAGFQWPGAPV